jgi:hypothetical protein
MQEEYFREADGSSQFYSYGSQLFAVQDSWFRNLLRKVRRTKYYLAGFLFRKMKYQENADHVN